MRHGHRTSRAFPSGRSNNYSRTLGNCRNQAISHRSNCLVRRAPSHGLVICIVGIHRSNKRFRTADLNGGLRLIQSYARYRNRYVRHGHRTSRAFPSGRSSNYSRTLGNCCNQAVNHCRHAFIRRVPRHFYVSILRINCRNQSLRFSHLDYYFSFIQHYAFCGNRLMRYSDYTRRRLTAGRCRYRSCSFFQCLYRAIIDLGHCSVTALPRHSLKRSIVRINSCGELDNTPHGYRGIRLVKTDGFHRNHLRLFLHVVFIARGSQKDAQDTYKQRKIFSHIA